MLSIRVMKRDRKQIIDEMNITYATSIRTLGRDRRVGETDHGTFQYSPALSVVCPS